MVMGIFQDFITQAAAGLAPIGKAPTAGADVGFGSDLSCDRDLTALAEELDQDSPVIVAQAAYRRLTTPRGSLVDDPDYGLDIRRFLHRGMTRSRLATIPGQIRNEISKDDRVLSVKVTLQNVTDLSFDISILGNCGTGAFTLTLGVTDAAVLLKEMRTAA